MADGIGQRAGEAHGQDAASGRDRGAASVTRLFGVGLLAAALAGGLWVQASSSAPETAAVGSRAPDFALPALGQPSRRVTLRGLRGRPVIVVFNCGCRACDDFDRSLAAAAPRLRGTQVVAVTMNPSAYEGSRLAAFRRRTGFRWPILVDERMEATRRYGADDCPRAWLVAGDGMARRETSGSAAVLLAGIGGLVPSAQAP